MRLDVATCRQWLAAAPVARLATTGHDGRPHIVPITFAVDGPHLVSAVDRKPKSSLDLRRLRNIAENPKVAVLGDHYSDDWSQLWWVRADGLARVVDGGSEYDAAITALSAKYEQYHSAPPHGPAIVIDVESWTGWSAEG